MSTTITAESILSSYRPDSKPIEVRLPSGEVMTFRPITTSEERRKLVDQVASFLSGMPERGTAAFKAHPFAKIWPKNVEDQSLSLILHFRAIDPPISQETAIAFHQAPELIAYIEACLANADKEIEAMARVRLLEEARKKSKTPGSEEGSAPVSELSQGETPTP